MEERQANLGVVGKSVGSHETSAKGKAETALFALSGSCLSSGQDRKRTGSSAASCTVWGPGLVRVCDVRGTCGRCGTLLELRLG
jgi:hypothetical protein